jgi:two-component system, response regulator / RNA-binding antiterminator
MRVIRVLLLWDDNSDSRALAQALSQAGCEVLGPLAPSGDIACAIASTQPALIIINAQAAERDTLEHLVLAHQHTPRPIVMVTDDDDEANIARLAFAAGVSAYVTPGLSPPRVASVLAIATAQFEAQEKVRLELAQVRTQLAERKQIERAKGWLMKRFAIDEDEAFRRIRQVAMQRQMPLADVARQLMDAADATSSS